MSLLPGKILRAPNLRQFYDDPLHFLARARSTLGDIFLLREEGPIFSRDSDCTGVLAVFGPAYQRAVLGDTDSFGLPISAAHRLALPENLVNLNRSLHSMRGEQHSQQRRLLARALSDRSLAEQHASVRACLETFDEGWKPGQRINLLAEMRRLALQMSTRLLFGNQDEEINELASLLRDYFHLRREATSPLNPSSESLRAELIPLGNLLDHALRQYIGRSGLAGERSSGGIIGRLARLKLDSGEQLSEDELVAHANVMFVSGNEPLAVALTWTLLILSQLPGLRRALRREIAEAEEADGLSFSEGLAKLALLDAVINESLRLLPPNAMMVRVTTRPVSLDGLALPARCELVLCPFLAHREAERFPRPNLFLPARWHGLRPSPYEYFPFGAGGHSCVGAQLATHLIKLSLAWLIARHEIVLAEDQEIDWRIHIMFMPRSEPVMSLGAPNISIKRGGKLIGPVSELVSLNGDYKS